MNRSCPGCRAGWTRVVRDGTYFRACDSRHIQRFRCRECARRFSAAVFSPAYRQKRRRINASVRALLCSTGSIRRTALNLGVDRKTVARRLPMLATVAREHHRQLLDAWLGARGPMRHVQFDELHTIEHTKCKPLSVAMLVDAEHRLILAHGVAQMPASGPLAALSRKKYGPRKDLSGAMREALFARARRLIAPDATLTSDEHRHYPTLVRRHLPGVRHVRHPSVRARTQGQGELKAVGRDPLFTINHTLAMLRANINRLIRSTWCTTKRADRLMDHLWIYIDFHNRELLGFSEGTIRTRSGEVIE